MKWMLALSLFLAALSAQAAANLNQGDWELGGGLNFSRNDSGSNVFLLNGNTQYFVADDFSAGLDFGFYTGSGQTDVYSLAPVFTKYVWVNDQLAPYLNLMPVQWLHGGNYTYYTSRARIGVKYFLTDSVAFGPAFEYSHQWSSPESDSFSFFGLFSIHL